MVGWSAAAGVRSVLEQEGSRMLLVLPSAAALGSAQLVCKRHGAACTCVWLSERTTPCSWLLNARPWPCPSLPAL